jgi:hypothetical protein
MSGPYVSKIIGDHLCGFWCNRSTTDQIILQSSDNWEKVGVLCDSISAIQESLWFR